MQEEHSDWVNMVIEISSTRCLLVVFLERVVFCQQVIRSQSFPRPLVAKDSFQIVVLEIGASETAGEAQYRALSKIYHRAGHIPVEQSRTQQQFPK